jgi:hypothetical protein
MLSNVKNQLSLFAFSLLIRFQRKFPSRGIRTGYAVLAIPLLFLSSSLASADGLTIGLSVSSGIDQIPVDEANRTSTNAGPTLTDSYDSSFASGLGIATFRSAKASASANAPGTDDKHIGKGGSAVVFARYQSSYTLRVANGAAATAHFTMLGSGSASASTANQSGASYSVTVDDGVSALASYGASTSQPSENPVPAIFHFDYPFTSDVPFSLIFNAGVNVGATSHTSEGPASSSASARIETVDIEPLDSNDQHLDYVLETTAGIGKGQTFTNGEPYSDFVLINDTNIAPQSHGTKISILDGVANTNTQLRATFVGPIDDTLIKQVSDCVQFTGTGTNLFVMQLEYDPALAQSQGVTESALRLLWRNPDTLKLLNAVAGNIGGTPKLVRREFNPATDFHLGTFGVDTNHHTVSGPY